MRYGPDDKFWVTTDPTVDSELADICFETTLRSLERQFRGGLTIGQNPTLFTDRAEAQAEAHLRMVAMRAANAIADAAPEEQMRDAARVTLLDREGRVIFESDLS
jgi:hypothetical protein